MNMRSVLLATLMLLVMPITGSGWAEGSNVLLDPKIVCKKAKRLRGRLAEICKNETALLREIQEGISIGFKECGYQFRTRRWNCTTLRKSMRKILMKDTRETGFVNAITAAGITYAITRACTMGDLVECSCDKNHARRHHNNVNKQRGQRSGNRRMIDGGSGGGGDAGNIGGLNDGANTAIEPINSKMIGHMHGDKLPSSEMSDLSTLPNGKKRKIGKNIVVPSGDWEWGGCDDNVNFGYRKSKDFLDARYRRRSDIKTLVKLHNNDAGRLAVKDYMRLECKCHGLSGSCSIKTCWLKMPSFREVGNRLKDRFDGAAKVIARNDGNSFMPGDPTIKPPSRQDLVYTDDSPDFCRQNHKTGSIGTHGRECNVTSAGVDGCDLMCCSRGYDHKFATKKVNCNCQFKWCCEVTCSQCLERREVYTCR